MNKIKIPVKYTVEGVIEVDIGKTTINIDEIEEILHGKNIYDVKDHNIDKNSLEINTKKLEASFFKDLVIDEINKNYADKNKVIRQHWYYDDNLDDSEILKNIFKRPNPDTSLENQIIEKLEYNEPLIFDNISLYKIVSDILLEYDLSDNIIDAIVEELYDMYEIDYNIKDLLKNTRPSDLTLYFGKNWDDAYMDETGWHEIDQDDYNNEKELEKKLETSLLAKFVKLQGHNLCDIFDENKRKDNDFLNQVYEEVYCYYNDLSGMQLIAIPNSSDWNTIYEIASTKNGKIKAGTKFGLFNRIHGSGSGLEIESIKDLNIEDLGLYELNPFIDNNSYNYSPQTVYGSFNRPTTEQLSAFYWDTNKNDTQNILKYLRYKFEHISECIAYIKYNDSQYNDDNYIHKNISFREYLKAVKNITEDDIINMYRDINYYDVPKDIKTAAKNMLNQTEYKPSALIHDWLYGNVCDFEEDRIILKWLSNRSEKQRLYLLDNLFMYMINLRKEE